MQRSWQRAASAIAQEDRLEPVAGRDEDDRALASPSATLAAAVGTALHRVLEDLDLELPLGAGLAAQRTRLSDLLRPLLGDVDLEAASARANETLDRFAKGPLFSRLDALRPDVVARELPIWQQPVEDALGPVGVVSGVIDLVHRDPGSGRLVVVDYKTDRVEGDALDERAAHYSGQAAAYVDALGDALGLDYRPRFELWFLHAGVRRALEL